jgi:hypothetical protein
MEVFWGSVHQSRYKFLYVFIIKYSRVGDERYAEVQVNGIAGPMDIPLMISPSCIK